MRSCSVQRAPRNHHLKPANSDGFRFKKKKKENRNQKFHSRWISSPLHLESFLAELTTLHVYVGVNQMDSLKACEELHENLRLYDLHTYLSRNIHIKRYPSISDSIQGQLLFWEEHEDIHSTADRL